MQVKSFVRNASQEFFVSSQEFLAIFPQFQVYLSKTNNKFITFLIIRRVRKESDESLYPLPAQVVNGSIRIKDDEKWQRLRIFETRTDRLNAIFAGLKILKYAALGD